MRNSCSKLTLDDFLKTQDQDIWDLKYISTSDEEDNDSDMASSDESEEETEKPVNEKDEDVLFNDETGKPLIKFEDSKNLPLQFKKFKKQVGQTNQPRVQYEYRYSNDPENQQEKPRKTVIVKKRALRRGPQNMIDMLIYQKLNMYEREERMRLLKEHDDSDWQKMQTEYNSSEEDDIDTNKRLQDETENYAWYRYNDPDSYFVLATKHKNLIEKDE